MKILVFGLGYVGSTMTACLLEDGHFVVGIDVADTKVELIRQGRSPIVEPGVAELLARGHAQGRLHADIQAAPYLAQANMAIVCVGTPSRRDGTLNLSQVVAAAREIGQGLAARPAELPPLLIVFRSTMPPSSMEELILPALAEAATEPPGHRYEVAFNPEFLREGSAIADYRSPPKIVIGERRPGTASDLYTLYAAISAPVFPMSLTEAEVVKFADNCFHAAKVVFANEIGRLCLGHGVDPQHVATVFLADTKLNISPTYLRPGGAFGGSCLPKDVRCIVARGRRLGLQLPLLESLLPSNQAHKEYLSARVLRLAGQGTRVLQVGLSFKSGTDDLRESPLVYLAQDLIEEGCDLSIYEPDLQESQLLGMNRQFAEDMLPDFRERLVTTLSGLPCPDLLVLGKPAVGMLPPAWDSVPTLDLHRLHHMHNARQKGALPEAAGL